MESKRRSSLVKLLFLIIGTALLVTAIVVVINNSNSEYHVILTVAALIIGSSFVGVSLPFKSTNKKEQKENTEIEFENKQTNKVFFYLAILYSYIIGIGSLISSIVVFKNKTPDFQEHTALAMALLLIGVIYIAITTLEIVYTKKEKK